MTHKLKIQPNYLEDLLDGKKTFEIRLNDRNYQVGDILKFPQLSGKTVDKVTFDYFRFEVIYLHSGLGLQEGYVCMSVRRIYAQPTNDKSRRVEGQNLSNLYLLQ